MYTEAVSDLVRHFFLGYNGTVMAHGKRALACRTNADTGTHTHPYTHAHMGMNDERKQKLTCTRARKGQTGSGKTHTMLGHGDDDDDEDERKQKAGLLPRAVGEIFDEVDRLKATYSFVITMQCVEICTSRPSVRATALFI